MHQSLKNTQKFTNNITLTQTMQNSLNILKMNQNELIDYINEFVNNNPLAEYIPSADMNQLIQDVFSTKPSLKDELYQQLHIYPFSYNTNVANYIIESLDNNGFLTETIEDYSNILDVSLEVVESTLKIIQSFEPIGVAAKNSIDSIVIQLRHKNFIKAINILVNYQNEIINKDFKAIAKSEKITIDDVFLHLSQIKSCTPYPCDLYSNSKRDNIVPDFYIDVDNKKITITPKDIGYVQIYNNYNKQILYNSNLINYFNEANFFIDAINKRNKTLLILANAIVDIQKSHFLYQDDLEPCTLQDIASLTGFHLSTVSRTLSNKFYQFENEIYPVKSLFSSKTKEGTGKDILLNAIFQLIQNEDKSNPLSDEQIAMNLETLGLYISRRGVAKYRKQLNIKNSKQRKL